VATRKAHPGLITEAGGGPQARLAATPEATGALARLPALPGPKLARLAVEAAQERCDHAREEQGPAHGGSAGSCSSSWPPSSSRL
jgi:hypothetical protein